MTITARVDDTDVATAVLVLSGPGARPTAVTLEGRRARVDGALTGRGGTWTARLPLAVSRWGGPRRPPSRHSTPSTLKLPMTADICVPIFHVPGLSSFTSNTER